jgi:hypothetical protein
MAKISELEQVPAPTGTETVVVLKDGIARRASIAGLVAAAWNALVAAATAALDLIVDQAETARDLAAGSAAAAQNHAADFTRRREGYKGTNILIDAAPTADSLRFRSFGRYDQVLDARVYPSVITERQALRDRTIWFLTHSGGETVPGTVVAQPDIFDQQSIGVQGTFPSELMKRLATLGATNPKARHWLGYNHAISAQVPKAIAARGGAVAVRLSGVTGGSVPAPGGGAVAVAGVSPDLLASSALRAMPIRVHGRLCRLVRSAPSGPYTIEQLADGVNAGALAVADGTLAWAETSNLEAGRVFIWLDRNDQSLPDANLELACLLAQRIWRAGGDPMFIGTWNMPGNNLALEGTGTDMFNKTITINNNYRRAALPFFDVLKFGRNEYPFDGTIWPRATDLAGISDADTDGYVAAGFAFKAFFNPVDKSHFNTAFHTAMATFITDYLWPATGRL